MNNKGFAVSGFLYTLLIIFMTLIVVMLFNLQNRKTILDELKSDTVEAVEGESNYQYLLDEINALKAQIGSTDISNIGDGTVTGAISESKNNYQILTSKGTVASVDNSWFSITELQLKAGYSYIVFGTVGASINYGGNAGVVSNLIITSGEYDIYSTQETRSNMYSGGGTTSVALVKCKTDCTITLRSYGYYNDAEYNLIGTLQAIEFH